MYTTKLSQYRSNLHLAGVFFFTLFLGALFAPYTNFDFIHEGLFFKPAIDLVEGKMVYRDSFTAYGVLNVLLQSLAIRLAGKHLIVAKYEVVLLTAISAVYLWLTWSRFCRPWLATLAIVLWNLMAYYFLHHYLEWASAYAVFFQVQSLYFLVRGVESRKMLFYFIAGLSAAGCFFSKQNVGLYLIFAEMGLVVLLRLASNFKRWRDTLRPALGLASGFAALLAFFLIWFYSEGALRDWWLQCFKWASDWGKIYGSNYSLDFILKCLFVLTGPNAPDGLRPSLIFGLLPLLTSVVFVVRFWQLRKGDRSQAHSIQFVTAAICLASWLQYYPVTGIGHLWWASTPMFGVALAFLFELTEKVCRRFKKTELLIPAFSVLCLIIFARALYRHLHFAIYDGKLAQATVKIPGNGILAGLRAPALQAKHAVEIEEAVEREINHQYAKPKVILIGIEAQFISMVKNAVSFHPIWATRHMEPIRSAYPTFPEDLDAYIRTEKPILLANRTWLAEIAKKYPGYEKVADVDEWFAILKAKQTN